MQLDTYWLAFAIAVLLPMVVALVTKQVASGTVKSLVLLALAAITGTLVQVQADGGHFDWKKSLSVTVVAFVTSVGFHFGLLKPLTVTGSQGAIQRATPNFLIGPSAAA